MYTFACQECGRKFKTASAAEKASMDGCAKCGGVDIDVDMTGVETESKPVPYHAGKREVSGIYPAGVKFAGE